MNVARPPDPQHQRRYRQATTAPLFRLWRVAPDGTAEVIACGSRRPEAA